MNYTFRTIIEPDEKGTYHGYAPALSGCHTWGETLEDTQKNLKDAISAYVASLIADGEQIPTDRGFESFETIGERDLTLAH
ncbi:MAG: type II toxin-antitoxin system HicB family antitoxin [bacterium]|nr:type II toxin-antitoxin system HicB family antitoxin [bacterium]